MLRRSMLKVIMMLFIVNLMILGFENPYIVRDSPEFYLVVMSLIKNQGDYLAEWIEFHLAQGVDKFVLYNHGSTDNTIDILKPYVELGIVELINWPAEAHSIEQTSGLHRSFLTGSSEQLFQSRLDSDCENVDPNRQHKQGGCQVAAFMDGMARYRHKTLWLTDFDVDEYIYAEQVSPN